MLIVNICLSACVRQRGGDGVGFPHGQTRRSESSLACVRRVLRSTVQVRLSKLVCYSTLAIGESSSQGDISTARHWRHRSARAALFIAHGKTSTAHAAVKPITRRVRDKTSCLTKQLNHTTKPPWPTSGASRSVFPSTQTRAQENRRAHARAPMKPREWTSRRLIKRHRRDAGSPS